MKSWISLGLGGLLLIGAHGASAQWNDGPRVRDREPRAARDASVRAESRAAPRRESGAADRSARSEQRGLPAGFAGVAPRSSQPERGRQGYDRPNPAPRHSGRDGRGDSDRGYRGHDDGWRNQYARDGNRGRDDDRGRDHDWNRGRHDDGRHDGRGRRDWRDDRRHDGRGHGDYRDRYDRHDYRGWSFWRHQWSHGWSGHRYRAPSRYYHPRGFSSRYWRIGLSVPLVYLANSYFVDYHYYGLAAPPYGYYWIRIDGDVMLVDRYTGEIVEILYGFYY